MANIPQPPISSPIADKSGVLTPAWQAWLSMLANMNNPQSGTTANRPKTGLYPGMVYLDTTLGYPVFVNAAGSGWIDATGAAR